MRIDRQTDRHAHHNSPLPYRVDGVINDETASTQVSVRADKLKFHKSNFLVASSLHPRDILARMLLTCHEEIGRVGRVGEDATRKLLPWNLSYTLSFAPGFRIMF